MSWSKKRDLSSAGPVSAVHYELFDPDSVPKSSDDILNVERQIVILANEPFYISWKPVAAWGLAFGIATYCVDVSRQSFFKDEPFKIRDVTRTEPWSLIVGRNVQFAARFPDLKIEVPDGSEILLTSDDSTYVRVRTWKDRGKIKALSWSN